MKELNLLNPAISLIILTQVGIQEANNLNPQQPYSIGGTSHKVNEVLIWMPYGVEGTISNTMVPVWEIMVHVFNADS